MRLHAERVRRTGIQLTEKGAARVLSAGQRTKKAGKVLIKYFGPFQVSFRCFTLKVARFEDIKGPSDFVLVEIKITRKHLPHLSDTPQGFFFGMTENEEMLLKVFGENALLCLVSVNPESEGYFLADWDMLQAINMNKRIQYQINIRRQ